MPCWGTLILLQSPLGIPFGNLVIKDLFLSQTSRLAQELQRHDWSSAVVLTEALARAWKENRQVFLCGNGGSGASACHWATDLVYPVSKKLGHGLKIRSLVSNPGLLTCLANDEGYEHIFSAQLRVQAEPGDLLIVLSGSGNSANILHALKYAREMGVRSFAILGFSGGKALHLADVPIHFQVDDMQLAEDFQVILGHLVMRALQQDAN